MKMHRHWIDTRYDEAVRAGSFKSLLPYPCLLLRWQRERREDARVISKIGSHRTTHSSCGDSCHIIDLWMKKVFIQSLCVVLQKKGETISQLSLV